jgi:hypothetical protein
MRFDGTIKSWNDERGFGFIEPRTPESSRGLIPFPVGRLPSFSLIRLPGLSQPIQTHDAQAKVLLESIEVTVAVKQAETVRDAACRNEHVDSAAHGDAERTKSAEVSCGLDSQVRAANVDLVELPEQPSGFVEPLVVLEALQDLRQNQVANHQSFDAKILIQPLGLRRRLVAEEVDPDAGIDKNHLSRLIASRSPTHSYLPRNLRSSVCRFNRSSVRSPSSTASRLVLKPVALRVASMSLSSMTMFVRMCVCLEVSYTL